MASPSEQANQALNRKRHPTIRDGAPVPDPGRPGRRLAGDFPSIQPPGMLANGRPAPVRDVPQLPASNGASTSAPAAARRVRIRVGDQLFRPGNRQPLPQDGP